jgi:hypothetical protein
VPRADCAPAADVVPTDVVPRADVVPIDHVPDRATGDAER